MRIACQAPAGGGELRLDELLNALAPVRSRPCAIGPAEKGEIEEQTNDLLWKIWNRARSPRRATSMWSTNGAWSTKIDGGSGDMGRIVWRMDPGQEKTPLANGGGALWCNYVITVANYPARVIATDKETCKVAWEANLSDGQAHLQLTAAQLPVKDKIVIGAAGDDRGVRDFIAALDGATGRLLWRKYTGRRRASPVPRHGRATTTLGRPAASFLPTDQSDCLA
jgi:hypothetical protein